MTILIFHNFDTGGSRQYRKGALGKLSPPLFIIPYGGGPTKKGEEGRVVLNNTFKRAYEDEKFGTVYGSPRNISYKDMIPLITNNSAHLEFLFRFSTLWIGPNLC